MENGLEEHDGPTRLVLSPEARRLYSEILRGGGPPVDEVPADPAHPLRQLLEIGLVMSESVDVGTFVAVDPQSLASRWSMALHNEATRLLDHVAGLSAQLRQLSEHFRSGRPPAVSSFPAEYVTGMARIQERIVQLVAGCTDEMVSVQPAMRARPLPVAAALERERELIARGVVRRVLYQGTVRHDPGVRAFVEEFSKLGGQVRTLDESFERIFVLDRKTAVLSAKQDPVVALITNDAAVVGYLLDCFERDWARADPFDEFSPVSREELSGTQRAIVRLLSQGLGQRAVAGRLRLSERTVAGHVARIREHYGATTLFQLALLIGREEARGLRRTDG